MKVKQNGKKFDIFEVFVYLVTLPKIQTNFKYFALAVEFFNISRIFRFFFDDTEKIVWFRSNVVTRGPVRTRMPARARYF